MKLNLKMLILELLEDGRTKKSLENEYGVATATIRKWEKEFKGIIDKKYNASETFLFYILLSHMYYLTTSRKKIFKK